MKRVKLTVAYDGTHYCGWQTQPNGITVQEVLEKHLSELLKETHPALQVQAERMLASMQKEMWRCLTHRPECRQKRFLMH